MKVLELKNQIRHEIYQHFVQTGYAPSIEYLCLKFNKNRVSMVNLLKELEADHLIVMQPKANRILFANPFSNIQTAFQVIDLETNNQYNTNCAWDAIATHFTLHHKIEVSATCYQCLDPVELVVDQGKIIAKNIPSVVVYFSKPVNEWWNDIIDTCANHMNFFCSSDHINEWELQNSIVGYELSDDQIIGLSKFLYLTKLDKNYSRPTLAETKNIFTDLGLTSEFWDL